MNQRWTSGNFLEKHSLVIRSPGLWNSLSVGRGGVHSLKIFKARVAKASARISSTRENSIPGKSWVSCCLGALTPLMRASHTWCWKVVVKSLNIFTSTSTTGTCVTWQSFLWSLGFSASFVISSRCGKTAKSTFQIHILFTSHSGLILETIWADFFKGQIRWW